MKEYIGYCGQDCEICEGRIATVNDDDEMRKRVALHWSKLNNAEITPEMINCSGCRIEGLKTPYCGYICEIRKCAINRAYETCGDCEELKDCSLLKAIHENNPQAYENLMNG
ncbi:MAG: DUF3795 domain-containing protein [Erysipelotrichaceae bacterium]|nr:DUF3795 domain-containing protein [Erysipelotrichaceae bacterium]